MIEPFNTFQVGPAKVGTVKIRTPTSPNSGRVKLRIAKVGVAEVRLT